MARRTAHLPFVRLKQVKDFLRLSEKDMQRFTRLSFQQLRKKDKVLTALLCDYYNSIESNLKEQGFFNVILTYGLLRRECVVRKQILPPISEDTAHSLVVSCGYSHLSGTVDACLVELFAQFEAQNQYLTSLLEYFVPSCSLTEKFQALRPAIMSYSFLEAQAEINYLEESVQ